MKNTILITGASGGIGKEFALVAAKNQNDVVLVARTEDRLKSLCEKITATYEVKADYQNTVDSLKDCLVRFASGTYVVWYPLLQLPEARQFLQRLKALQLPSWLNVSLSVQGPSKDGFGMHGSGLFIVNPPWTLPKLLQSTLPWLVQVLGQDAEAGYTLDHQIP